MKPLLIIALLAAAPAIAQAQVYKCVENGKTIYAERPCSAKAQELNIGDSAATEQRLQAEQRGRQAGLKEAQERYDRAASIRLEALEKADRRRAESAPKKPSKEERCAFLLKEAKRGKDDANMYRYHQGLIDDAKRRQKEAEDAHFSECYGS